ncbi:hypothetical protein Pmani_001605 [Petrolisthes manimaculis]|uniref:Uncharacterized protein n=1 Tax=Petrolisthes manimaculis TaxID=1843537 RepID=A0AAE1QK39_9EUCA|nr:hypothetical protein Pmani_001605 [Petrolisthes manimaculis]
MGGSGVWVTQGVHGSTGKLHPIVVACEESATLPPHPLGLGLKQRQWEHQRTPPAPAPTSINTKMSSHVTHLANILTKRDRERCGKGEMRRDGMKKAGWTQRQDGNKKSSEEEGGGRRGE